MLRKRFVLGLAVLGLVWGIGGVGFTQIADVKLIKTLTGHNSNVESIALSHDGRYLASKSYDDIINLWEMPEGKLINTLHGYDVESIAVSHDGRYLAVGCMDSNISLLAMPEGRLINTLTGHNTVLMYGILYGVDSVAFSPDGRYLVSGGCDNTLKLWAIPEGKLIKTLIGHGNYAMSVVFSPDGKYLASGSRDATIKLWAMPRGELINTLTGHNNVVQSVAFSPDGRYLASGSWDKTINLWKMPEGELINTLTGHNNVVRSVAFSPDGRYLASGSDDKTINLWKIPKGELIQTLTGHNGDVNSVVFSPDGRYLLSGSYDNTIKLWEIPDSPVATNEWVVNSKVANIRSGPSTKHSVIGQAEKGEKIFITGEEGDWYRVMYNDKIGYIHKSLMVKVLSTSTAKTTTQDNNSSKVGYNYSAHSNFQTFWTDFKKAVNANDKEAVAQMTYIPFQDGYQETYYKELGGVKPLTLTATSISDFLNKYDKIIIPATINAINANQYRAYQYDDMDIDKGEYVLVVDANAGRTYNLAFSKKGGVYKLSYMPYYE